MAGEDTAVLKAMIGAVDYFAKGSTAWQSAKEGSQLSSGDKIRTGADGMASVSFTNGSQIMLKPNTEFEITSLSKSEDKNSIDYKLQLNMGKLRAMVEKLDSNSSFEIKTPTAVAAIRGTVYYLNVREAKEEEIPADIKERLTTDLFVEAGGVLYTSIVSGKYFIVNTLQTSTTYEDGSVTIPIDVPPDRQPEWTEGWELLTAEPYESAEDKNLSDLFTNDGGGEEDARLGDKVNQVVAAAIELYDERNAIWQEMCNKLLEREYLRSEIYEILEANSDRRVEGYAEKISDAQTGKVLKDIHGNRVRMEQYVLRPSSDTVEVLNVNLRAGNDLTTMEWTTKFNQPLDELRTGQLKTLPWNSYLETKEFLGVPYIESPYQSGGTYPAHMNVAFSHTADAFSEGRDFAPWILGTQTIHNQELWVKSFNNNEAMAYTHFASDYQAPGTYSITNGLQNAIIGGKENNPLGFSYNFTDEDGNRGTINSAFYVMSDPLDGMESVRQDGHADVAISNIWDALRVNMAGSNKQIGENNLEMVFTSTKFQSGDIDLIYVPMLHMQWKDDDNLPNYTLP